MDDNRKISQIIGELYPESGNIEITLNPGLNIIAGGNGVGKTFLLKLAQTNAQQQGLRVHKFDPKRNAAKEIAANAEAVIRQDVNFKNNSLSSFLQQIQNDGVQSILSINSSIINFCNEKVKKEDKKYTEATNEASNFFSTITNNIFPNIKFNVNWDSNQTRFDILLIKNEKKLKPLLKKRT